MFVGGAGDERVRHRSAGRARHRAGLRTGWQPGPSVTHERESSALAFAQARLLALARRARASRRAAVSIWLANLADKQLDGAILAS